jgi:hypothetical protein
MTQMSAAYHQIRQYRILGGNKEAGPHTCISLNFSHGPAMVNTLLPHMAVYVLLKLSQTTPTAP